MLDGQKALETLKQYIDNPSKDFWSRLKDSTDSMDDAQKSFVLSQDEVKETYREMAESFNSYIFEKFKDDFVAVPAFQPVVERYIDTVLKSAQKYGQHAKDLEEENKKLKQQLEEALNANRHTSE